MSLIQPRRRWNGWSFIVLRIQAALQRRAGRGYFCAVIFGLRSWVRAWRKESSASAKPSKRRYGLSTPNISPVCVRPPKPSVADSMIQDRLPPESWSELNRRAHAEFVALKADG